MPVEKRLFAILNVSLLGFCMRGRLGDKGSVQWMFEHTGVIRIAQELIKDDKREDFELAAIDAGANDIQEEDNEFLVITKPEQLASVADALKKLGYEAESAEFMYVTTNPMDVDTETLEKLEKLIDALLDLDDVQQVYTAAA